MAEERIETSSGRLTTLLPQREGGFWVLLALAMPRVAGAFFTIALRRFIGPRGAGLFDTAMVPYRFLDSVRSYGVGPALIYEREIDRGTADTAWTVNMLFALGVTAIAQLLAHPVALYYRRPEVEPILRVLSIAYVFASAGSVHFFLLLRRRDFQARSMPAIGQVLAAGIIALLFAFWGFGVGTFVARELSSVIMGSVLLWVVFPYRPHIRLIPEIAWRLMRYGIWVGVGLTVLYLSQNADLFIGARVIRSNRDIGFYSTSWSLSFIAAGVFTTVATTMVFPSLSRLREDRAALQETLLRALRQIGLVVFPSAALLAVVAPVIIVPLLGEKWAAYRSSYIVLSLLAIYGGNRTMLLSFFEGYKAVGLPWIIPAYNLAKLVIMAPTMYYAAHHGITGLAVAYIPLQLVEIPTGLFLARSVLGVRVGAVARALWTPFLGTLLMVGAVAAVEIGLHSRLHLGDTPILLVCLPLGAAIYLATLTLIDRAILREALHFLTRGL
jgi:O-antigen/teichoic acid export membrane protein